MSVLEQIAGELRGTAAEIRDFMASNRNDGPFAEEIYRTNVQIQGALDRLADHIEELGR